MILESVTAALAYLQPYLPVLGNAVLEASLEVGIAAGGKKVYEWLKGKFAGPLKDNPQAQACAQALDAVAATPGDAAAPQKLGSRLSCLLAEEPQLRAEFEALVAEIQRQYPRCVAQCNRIGDHSSGNVQINVQGHGNTVVR